MISPRTVRNLRSEFRHSLMAKIGVVLLISILLASIFAPFLALHDPTHQYSGESNNPPIGFGGETETATTEVVDGEVQTTVETVEQSPTMEHPLGTDALGRDMFSRLLFGARTSILVGLTATTLAATAGVVYGLTAGYYGGRIDDGMMRLADIMLAFPSLVLAVTLIGLYGTGSIRIPDPWVGLGLVDGMPESFVFPGTITVVIALVSWVWFARVARGEALSLRDEDYVRAARTAGASDWYLLRKHLLPNCLTPIIVLATVQVAVVILLESALAFLGFSGTQLSWGFDVAQGRDYLATSWWITTLPGMAILLTVVAINLIGDWFRDALDPDISGEEGGTGA
ncbi:ABC transporter permease [Natronococcus sp. A-GB1]|uniref:ABC transporter permease n=1 Tax=Natronococcus sp. A-GB1 TaxID=3037648 RepID=UPI00241F44C5|nr:ABC transporter permease [Natronococcus sp. A-GB1]MDG5761797.1 ABC transporter permease [Natronococcus sp. A-GB1]